MVQLPDTPQEPIVRYSQKSPLEYTMGLYVDSVAHLIATLRQLPGFRTLPYFNPHDGSGKDYSKQDDITYERNLADEMRASFPKTNRMTGKPDYEGWLDQILAGLPASKKAEYDALEATKNDPAKYERQARLWGEAAHDIRSFTEEVKARMFPGREQELKAFMEEFNMAGWQHPNDSGGVSQSNAIKQAVGDISTHPSCLKRLENAKTCMEQAPDKAPTTQNAPQPAAPTAPPAAEPHPGHQGEHCSFCALPPEVKEGYTLLGDLSARLFKIVQGQDVAPSRDYLMEMGNHYFSLHKQKDVATLTQEIRDSMKNLDALEQQGKTMDFLTERLRYAVLGGRVEAFPPEVNEKGEKSYRMISKQEAEGFMKKLFPNQLISMLDTGTVLIPAPIKGFAQKVDESRNNAAAAPARVLN
jgi:hypothetical protein